MTLHRRHLLSLSAALAAGLGLPADAVYSFQTLWRLASTDLIRKET